MPNSLKVKLSKLRYKGKITQEEYEELIHKLDGHNAEIFKEAYALGLEKTKVGKWIHWTDDYKDYATCSCCEYGAEGEVFLKDITPYCPVCGAKMEG